MLTNFDTTPSYPVLSRSPVRGGASAWSSRVGQPGRGASELDIAILRSRFTTKKIFWKFIHLLGVIYFLYEILDYLI